MLEAAGKVGGAGGEVAVGVVARWQGNDMHAHAGVGEATGEMLRGLLAGAVFVLVEDEVDRTIGPLGELLELLGGEMGTEGTGGIAKAGLP